METALRFIVTYEVWIYAGLSLGALYYLLQIPAARRRLSQTVFGLEREIARAQIARAVSLLVIVVSILVAVFVVTTFVVPTMPINAERPDNPTPVEAVGTASNDPLQIPGEGAATSAPPLAQQVDNSGCHNPQATLTYPADGSEVIGAIEVRGTADIPNFALYKFEVAGASTGGRWQTISAGTFRVKEGFLGNWESSSFPPGQYAFRLVVSDTAGNSPPPCARLIEILPPVQAP